MKVLIIDEIQEHLSGFENLIRSDDIQVCRAANAEEALVYLNENDFAVVLVDIQMPELNGSELAKLIRGVKRHKNLPILFLTASKEVELTLQRVCEGGAIDVLSKPLEDDVVRSKLGIFIQLAKQKQQLEVQAREVDELRERADEAAVAKGRFLANMSHEIRTPLGAVLGFADILATNADIKSVDRAKFADAIKRNGQLLLRLIEDVIDLTRIEAGKIELENTVFSLEDLMKDVGSTVNLKAKERGLSLILQNHAGNLNLSGDFGRIKQILLNLLGNSVKFTDKGTVELAVSVGDENRIEFRVRDPGLGMTSDQAGMLFQRFAQLDATVKKKFGGSGLGLMLSKQLAREMGGDLILESSIPSQGSTFLFWMPLADSEIKTGTKLRAETSRADFLRDKSILFVDDSRDNHDLVRYMFKDTGAEVQCVDSGRECLEVLKSHSFDCCLMDVQMPEMDGMETAQRARDSGYKGPILALTAYAGQLERQKCFEAGCEAVITKPIDRQRLFDQLQDVLAPASSS